MFKIDDVVRLIPPNYIGIHKTFNSPYHWNQSNSEMDEHLMLGGEYRVLNVSKETETNRVFYSLLKNPNSYMGSALEEFLLLDESVVNCPFQVGDSVKLALSDEEIKKQFFPKDHSGYSFFDKNTIYQVTDVLNNFYIFLNYSKGHPKSAPFRWDNFKKV